MNRGTSISISLSSCCDLPTSRPVVWLVDDDSLLADDLIRYWNRLAPHAFHFRYFPKAQEAWKTWKQRSVTPQLHAIVVDGHLKNDDGELVSGAGFIRRLRACNVSPLPYLIGFSGDPFALEEMERAGSDAGFEKGQVKAVLDYLISPELYSCEDVLA